MRTIVSLRVTALTLIIVSVFFLASCGTSSQTGSDASGIQTSSTSGDAFSFLSQVSERFTSNEDFLTCTKRNIDMCMQEVIYSSGGDGSSLDCNEFLSEQNKDACIFTKTTSDAQTAGDVTLCDSLTGEGLNRCRMEVGMTFAMISGDLSFCETLDAFEKVACNNRIIMSQITQTSDEALCEKILSYEGDTQDMEKQMCEEQVKFMLQMQEEQARLDVENARINAEQQVIQTEGEQEFNDIE